MAIFAFKIQTNQRRKKSQIICFIPGFRANLQPVKETKMSGQDQDVEALADKQVGMSGNYKQVSIGEIQNV